MATLDEARQQFPQLRNLPDAAVADALYNEFYSDMNREEFNKRIGFDPATPAPPVYGPGDVVMPRDEPRGNITIRSLSATDPDRGVIERTVEGAKGGFGDRELGISAQTRADYPAVSLLQPLVAAPVDAALRTVAAAVGAVSGGLAGLAEKAGLSPADADRLQRDLNVMAQAAAIEAPVAGPGVPRRVPRAQQRAAAATPEPVKPGSIEALARDAFEADTAAAAIETPAMRLADETFNATARARVEADRLANAGVDRAGNINLSNIFAPEDVKAVIKQTAAENAEFLPARRGVITQAETRDMAGLLGMSAEDLGKRRIGQAFNAEEMLAARSLLVNQATKVRDLARIARDGSAAEKAQFAQEVTRLVAIQEQVAGATAEAGRALAQFRMMAGASREEIARMVEASKGAGIDDMARRIAELDDPAKVANFAANAYKATTADKVYEAWINALLSGPQTHASNILSNTLVAAWNIPETATAAAISKLTGSGIAGREVLARTFGFFEGAKEGLAAAGHALRTEQPSGATMFEPAKPRAIGGVGGQVVRIPSRLLMGEDEFFKAIAYRQEINALAMRQGLKEGLGGRELAERIVDLKSNPTEAMREAAGAFAEKQTFTNPLGTAGQGVQQAVQNFPGARYIVPFIRTPANLIKYAADRSVFAPLFKEARENLSGANGPIARDNQIARITLGTTVSATAAYMAADGTITGGGPADPQKRALLRATGWQPYSVKIGDTYYSYARIEPLGMLFGVAADMVEMYDTLTKDEKADLAVLMTGSASRNLISKNWLAGPSNAAQAALDPERYGAWYAQKLAGTAVPAGVAQWANASDPYMREARTMLDAVRARIPGEREKLFAKRDVFGEPITREGALWNDTLSPIYMSTAKDDLAAAELVRLKVIPGRLPRTIRNTELQPAEYDFYSEQSGKMAKAGLDALVALPQWRDLPEAVQVDAMQDVIRKSRDQARSLLFHTFPDLPMRVLQETMKKKRIPQSTAQPTAGE